MTNHQGDHHPFIEEDDMALIQGLLAYLARSAGTILNTAFGWATILLFGKVREDRQIYLSATTFGSVAWIVVALGIVFPSLATFLLSFATLPSWVDKNMIRLVMLGLTVLLPAVIGIVSIFMLEPQARPKSFSGKLKVMLSGYPYTF